MSFIFQENRRTLAYRQTLFSWCASSQICRNNRALPPARFIEASRATGAAAPYRTTRKDVS